MYSGLYAAEQTILQLHSGYSKWIEPVTNKRVLKGDKNLISHPKYFRNPKFPNFAKLCFVVVFSEAFFWLVPVRQVTSTVWSIPIFSVLKKAGSLTSNSYFFRTLSQFCLALSHYQGEKSPHCISTCHFSIIHRLGGSLIRDWAASWRHQSRLPSRKSTLLF